MTALALRYSGIIRELLEWFVCWKLSQDNDLKLPSEMTKKPLGIVAQMERKSYLIFFFFSAMHYTESPSSGNTPCHGTSISFALGFEMSTLTPLLSYLPYSEDVHPPCIYISHDRVSHLLWSQLSSKHQSLSTLLAVAPSSLQQISTAHEETPGFWNNTVNPSRMKYFFYEEEM